MSFPELTCTEEGLKLQPTSLRWGFRPLSTMISKGATDAMAKWLNQEYALTPSETAQVLGTAAEYKVNEVADRNAGVVLRINRQRLAGLIKKNKT